MLHSLVQPVSMAGPAVDNNQAIEWKEASRGEIRNCIFSNYNRGAQFGNTLTHFIDADGTGGGSGTS